jgi:hypothetical protein
VILGGATADRPVSQGGFEVDVPDPRGLPALGRIYDVRMRLMGPTSWFSTNDSSATLLTKIPEYTSAETWAEFTDYLIGSRVYAEVNLERLAIVPEPSNARSLILGLGSLLNCFRHGARRIIRPSRSLRSRSSRS